MRELFAVTGGAELHELADAPFERNSNSGKMQSTKPPERIRHNAFVVVTPSGTACFEMLKALYRDLSLDDAGLFLASASLTVGV